LNVSRRKNPKQKWFKTFFFSAGDRFLAGPYKGNRILDIVNGSELQKIDLERKRLHFSVIHDSH